MINYKELNLERDSFGRLKDDNKIYYYMGYLDEPFDYQKWYPNIEDFYFCDYYEWSFPKYASGKPMERSFIGYLNENIFNSLDKKVWYVKGVISRFEGKFFNKLTGENGEMFEMDAVMNAAKINRFISFVREIYGADCGEDNPILYIGCTLMRESFPHKRFIKFDYTGKDKNYFKDIKKL